MDSSLLPLHFSCLFCIFQVWFSDMSQNDVVYGICVQREMKKVTVVFRGTVNAHNWKMNLKFDTNEYHNPVKQNYPGRVDELSLHSGFALYLLRKRKDTGISKLQEIFDKIDEIGREMAPDGNYKLSITGHSLGGACKLVSFADQSLLLQSLSNS